MLLQISVHELHNNLIDTVENGGLECARNSEGKVVVSDTALRYLLPPQLKPMTPLYKQTYSCEMFLLASSMQQSLNAWHLCFVRNKEHQVQNM